MGSAAARHLATAGVDVVVVGPEEPGAGEPPKVPPASFYDDMRQIELAVDNLVLGQLALASLSSFRDLERETSIRFIDDHPSLRVGPPLSGPDEWDPVRAVAKTLGVEYQELDTSSIASRYPSLGVPAGYRGLVSLGGGIINPREMVRAQLSAAEKRGATIINDAATRLRYEPGSVVVETHDKRAIRVDEVLIATGAYVNETKLLRRRLALHLSGLSLVEVEVRPGGHSDMPILTAVLPGAPHPRVIYAMPSRKSSNGKTYIRGISFRAVAQPDGEGGSHASVENDPSVLVDGLREVIPGIEIGAATHHTCMTSYTNSGAPYIDRIDDRTAIAVGGNAWGIMTSDEIGRLAASLVRGEGWSGSLEPDVFRAHFS
jgi:sarcosine oxidase